MSSDMSEEARGGGQMRSEEVREGHMSPDEAKGGNIYEVFIELGQMVLGGPPRVRWFIYFPLYFMVDSLLFQIH